MYLGRITILPWRMLVNSDLQTNQRVKRRMPRIFVNDGRRKCSRVDGGSDLSRIH